MHDERGQMIIPWLIPWEDSKFLQFRKGDLLRFAARKPAKEKQSQCMMRGTSHPTAPAGRSQCFYFDRLDSPNFSYCISGKERKAVHGQRGYFIPYTIAWEGPIFSQFIDYNLLSADFHLSAKKEEENNE